MLLVYILNGIPENSTVSIVDMTRSEPRSLCCSAKCYETEKMFEVLALEKCTINGQVDYFIRVKEFS